ncbi:hypothetical protein [Fimbriiglobus ruber]|uniref:Serine/threonine protein kinase n=1 Tax=Fimbriiglobus ruber TaxID=1908690 RepID=A0A225DVY0_9BACT|nr:hypothetical protein [Fimbriiglobus ruber]OWK45193.1 Serine/threonine protein kinase [Fimbriiglobus ruber]
MRQNRRRSIRPELVALEDRDTPTATIFPVAGGASFVNGSPATAAQLAPPTNVAADAVGDVFIADTTYNRVLRVDAKTGAISTLAGNGTAGFSGDGGPATAAQLNGPTDVAADAAGDVFIVDNKNNRVRRVDAATGVITTVAGNGRPGLSQYGGPATATPLEFPNLVAVDAAGDIFITETESLGTEVVRVDAKTAVITTVAGNGVAGFSGDGGPATAAEIEAAGLAVDAAGNVFLTDPVNNRVRRVDAATGVITTVAGGASNLTPFLGGPATAAFLQSPASLAVDAAGNLLLENNDTQILRVDATTNVITAVDANLSQGFSGDGGPTSAALFGGQLGLAVDATGDLFVADTLNHRIRKVTAATGIINTIAGGGTTNGGPATAAALTNATGTAVDAAGNFYFADSDRIWKVDPATGIITAVSGSGTPGFSGDGGPATAAQVVDPVALAVDAAGDVFIADANNNRIRRVDATTGIITTVAGNGTAGFSGDGGPATAAQLNAPSSLSVDAAGDVFVADTQNDRVRRIDATTGVITTVAGNGTAGFSGDGGPATAAQLNGPSSGLSVDAAGDVFVADTQNDRVRRIDATTGVITTVAGSGSPSGPVGSGRGADYDDGGPATAATVSPNALAVDAGGNLFIADLYFGVIRRVDATTGIITTVAGNGLGTLIGPGGPVTAPLLSLGAMAIDPAGSLFVADGLQIDEVQLTTTPAVVPGSVLAAFSALGPNPRATAADLNGDGVTDYIGVTTAGVANQVEVLDGLTHQLTSFAPFEATFTSGLYVSTADLTGTGHTDVIVTPDQGGGPVVAVYDGAALDAGTTGNAAQIARFFGIADPNFRGGDRAAASTVNGTATLVVSAGFGGGPRIAIFNAQDVASGSSNPSRLVPDFFAFEDTLRNGAFVAAGDLTGDGVPDLAFGGGPDGAPRVRVFDGAKLLAAGSFSTLDQIAGQAEVADFFSGDPTSRVGVRIAIRDVFGSGSPELAAESGAGGPISVYSYGALTANSADPTADETINPMAGVFVD